MLHSVSMCKNIVNLDVDVMSKVQFISTSLCLPPIKMILNETLVDYIKVENAVYYWQGCE